VAVCRNCPTCTDETGHTMKGWLIELMKEFDRSNMIKEVLKNQERVNEYYFTKEKLEKLDFKMLCLVCGTSKHMVLK
jgi:hypothetical protein